MTTTEVDDAAFSAAWWLRNPHAQTIWGGLTRSRRLVDYRREALTTPDGDELLVDHAEGDPDSPRLILLHGLEGSSYSVYIQGVASAVRQQGWSVTAMNFRSCARDPQRISRFLLNRRPRFYHSGDTADFDFLLKVLAQRTPHRKTLAFGASLGGNVLLKWLGENPGQQLVTAAATLSVPYDLAAGAVYLEKRLGRIYVGSFLRTLRLKVQSLSQRFPQVAGNMDVERALAARTFREFDDAATAPLHGFSSAADYYARSSSIALLDRIDTPVLAISALDDPFLPPEVLIRVRDVASPSVNVLTTPFGGHVGFVSGSPWRSAFWAEAQAVRWLLRLASS